MGGSVESRLTMRLVDRVTGPARQVRHSLHAIDKAGRAAQGKHAVGGPTTAQVLASGKKMLLIAGGTYALARGAQTAYKSFASLDRQMTRIAITADATPAAGRAALEEVRRISEEVALTNADVVEGLDSLVAAGRSLPDALSFLPAVARTAQASGAEVADIAKTADAVGNSLGITADQMQSAFDIMVAGGKAGKFELKDMAQYLPSLAPAAAAIGLKGEEGLRKLVAMLQIARTQTGSAGEAATNLANVFQKMETDETAKKFKNFGVDLRKEMKRARREGRDLFETFLDLSEKALKGDLSKIPQLFTDAQFGKGMRAMLAMRKEMQALQASLRGVDGATVRDLANVTNDAQAAVDRLSNSWSNFVTQSASLADSIGVTDEITRAAEDFSKISEAISKIKKKGVGATAEVLQDAGQYIFQETDQTRDYEKQYAKAVSRLSVLAPEIRGQKPRFEDVRERAKTPGDIGLFGSDEPRNVYADVIYDALRKSIGEPTSEAISKWFEAAATKGDLKELRAERGRVESEIAKSQSGPNPLTVPGLKMRLDELNAEIAKVEKLEAAKGNAVKAAHDAYRKNIDQSPVTTGQRLPVAKPEPVIPTPRPKPAATEAAPRATMPTVHIQPAPSAPLAPIGVPFEPQMDLDGARRQLEDFLRDAGESIELPPVKVAPSDLGPQADATMGSFRTGLHRQMAATEADVDAFVARLRSKLSFSANPRIAASMSVSTKASPAAAQSTSVEAINRNLGQQVADASDGSYSDFTLT